MLVCVLVARHFPALSMDEDTDVLLVLLETSLPSQLVVRREELLEALISAGGDVELASRTLNEAFRGKVNPSPVRKPNSKRKAGAGLDDWLKSSKRRLSSESSQFKDDGFKALPSGKHSVASNIAIAPRVSSFRQHSANSPSSLAMVLRDNSSRRTHTVQPLPVRLLSTPEAVANHTPTTLHTSILPAGESANMVSPRLV